MPVHIYGHMADMTPLMELARSHGLAVVEDAAEAHGAECHGRRAGGIGTLACFSFYANKIVTTGEGGMVVTDDEVLAERLRSLRNLAFQRDRRFWHTAAGHNFRMTNVQAGIGLAQVARIEDHVAHKRRMAALYNERLGKVAGLQLPVERPGFKNVYWMYGVVLDDAVPFDATEFASRLKARGVDTRPFFVGMHEQPVLRERGLFVGEQYPATERLARRGILSALGAHPRRHPDRSGVRRRAGVARVTVFGVDYADCYDILYRAKDYTGEVDLVERLLAKHGTVGPKSILDLGSGTGSHALPLAQRGHRVTGVDRSPGMLAQARAKAATLPLAHAPEFIEGDICRHDLGRRFDAALMMFMVLGYQFENADLLAALVTLRKHLAPAGLFVFDVWNGLAVLAQRPGERTAEASVGDTRIVRRTRTRLEPIEQLCHVHFDIERNDAGGTTAWEETHTMRFFFPQELDLVLRCNGMRLLQLSSFPDGEGPPDEQAWNIIGVAQAM